MTNDLSGTYTRNLDFGFWHCQYSNMENLRNFGLILKVYLKFRFLGPYTSLEMATEKSILWCSSFIFNPKYGLKTIEHAKRKNLSHSLPILLQLAVSI